MNRTRKILREYGYKPRKERGQRFLVNESTLEKIARAAHIKPGETVVEIGPGPGNLTRHLVQYADRVIAIEIEHELCSILKAELTAKNLTVIEADALDFDFKKAAPPEGRLKLVANLPYNITTPILFKLLETPELFSEALILVQEEVAKRICAPPGKKPYGILSVRTQLLADCEIALHVDPRAFSPRPKVDSALVRIKFLETPRAPVKDAQIFRRTVKAAFARRRKTIRNSFQTFALGITKDRLDAALRKANIDPGQRAETVTVSEFAALANILADSPPGGADA